jgi:hypothetical protein
MVMRVPGRHPDRRFRLAMFRFQSLWEPTALAPDRSWLGSHHVGNRVCHRVSIPRRPTNGLLRYCTKQVLKVRFAACFPCRPLTDCVASAV